MMAAVCGVWRGGRVRVMAPKPTDADGNETEVGRVCAVTDSLEPMELLQARAGC